MEIHTGPETARDYDRVANLVQLAFAQAEHSNHDEHDLVSRLRHSRVYIPELSLVAELDGQVVGHLLMTRIKILGDGQAFDSLARLRGQVFYPPEFFAP